MDCGHLNTELRERRTAHAVQYACQCMDCGARVGNWEKKPLFVVPFWDHEAEAAAHARRWEVGSAEAAAARVDRKVAFDLAYDRFRASPEWREQRRLVMTRDQRTCQSCRAAPATQVHHRSYPPSASDGTPPTHEAFARYPLFELVAVCVPCHRHIHGLPDRDP
jgi:hypothetical protein